MHSVDFVFFAIYIFPNVKYAIKQQLVLFVLLGLFLIIKPGSVRRFVGMGSFLHFLVMMETWKRMMDAPTFVRFHQHFNVKQSTVHLFAVL